MKRIYNFFKLWIYWGDIREAYRDNKFRYDKKIQQEITELIDRIKQNNE